METGTNLLEQLRNREEGISELLRTKFKLQLERDELQHALDLTGGAMNYLAQKLTNLGLITDADTVATQEAFMAIDARKKKTFCELELELAQEVLRHWLEAAEADFSDGRRNNFALALTKEALARAEGKLFTC